MDRYVMAEIIKMFRQPAFYAGLVIGWVFGVWTAKLIIKGTIL